MSYDEIGMPPNMSSSRPLRAQDRWFLGSFPCALAAAELGRSATSSIPVPERCLVCATMNQPIYTRLRCGEDGFAMPQSYQTISAGLRQRAHQFEPFGWLVSILAFFAIGLLDDIAIRFWYIFFWGLFLGPFVSLIRRAPDLAFLSAVSFGTMIIPTDGDRYQQTLLSPLRLTIVLICYSAMFALIRTVLLTLARTYTSLFESPNSFQAY
jgi:hypothetical protein